MFNDVSIALQVRVQQEKEELRKQKRNAEDKQRQQQHDGDYQPSKRQRKQVCTRGVELGLSAWLLCNLTKYWLIMSWACSLGVSSHAWMHGCCSGVADLRAVWHDLQHMCLM